VTQNDTNLNSKLLSHSSNTKFGLISLFNCNSLNHQKLRLLAAHASFYCPSIICLTETWYRKNDDYDPILGLNGLYGVFRQDRLGGQRGGGVCILVKNSSNSASNAYTISKGSISQKIEYIILSIDIDSTNYYLGLIYRSPTSDLEPLQTLLRELKPYANKNLLLLGDLNFPAINWKTPATTGLDPCSSLFKLYTINNALEQLVTEPTRHRGSSSSLLDLVLTNQAHNFISCTIGPPLGPSCDHCSILLHYTTTNSSKSLDRPRLNFQKGNYNLANALIHSLNWRALLGQTYDVDKVYSKFMSAISSIISFSIPLKPQNQGLKGYPPHIRRIQQTLSAIDHNSGEDVIERKLNLLKTLKKEVLKYDRKVEEKVSLGNSKQFFSFILKRLNSSNSIGPIHHEDQIITDNQTKSNLFANYFSSVYKHESISIPEPNSSKLDYIDISYYDVFEALTKLPNKVSTSPDFIPSIFLKQTASTIAGPLTIIFRQIMLQGSVPKIWKTAIVTPIHKKESKTNVANYRPISLTCITCRVLERLVQKRLSIFIERGQILSPKQHGFLTRRSTFSAFLNFNQDCANTLQNGASLFACYFDFAKAYDSVSHGPLLNKLANYGIGGSLYKFFVSFLVNRTFVVRVGDSTSDPLPAPSGVPQGSVLAPLLFNLFLNDIFSGLPASLKVCAYADDLKIWSLGDPTLLQRGIDAIMAWSEEFRLPINYQKTQVMTIGKANTASFHIGNDKIAVVNSIRDLGLYYDNQFTFALHVDKIYQSSMKKLNLIFRAFTTNKPATLLRLFTTFVLAKLEYLSQIWNPNDIAAINKIESIQRKFTKRLFFRLNNATIPYESRLQELHLIDLKHRRLILDLTAVYKIFHGITFTEEPQFQPALMLGRTRGHHHKLQPFRVTKTKPAALFHTRIVPKWNALPSNIISAPNHKAFHKLVTAHVSGRNDDDTT